MITPSGIDENLNSEASILHRGHNSYRNFRLIRSQIQTAIPLQFNVSI